MSRNVLVAPTIDYAVGSGLWDLSAGADERAVSKQTELIAGQTLFRFQLKEPFASKSQKSGWQSLMSRIKDGAEIDLSVKAPIDGMYHVNESFFGSSHNAPYEEKDAPGRNPLANTFDQARFGISGLRAASFAVISDQQAHNTGLGIYQSLFDTLESKEQIISEWLKSTSSYVGGHDRFWQIVSAEKRRLQSTQCPVIPYGEHGR